VKVRQPFNSPGLSRRAVLDRSAFHFRIQVTRIKCERCIRPSMHARSGHVVSGNGGGGGLPYTVDGWPRYARARMASTPRCREVFVFICLPVSSSDDTAVLLKTIHLGLSTCLFCRIHR